MFKKKVKEQSMVGKKYFLVCIDATLFDEFQNIAPSAQDQNELIEKFVRGLVDRVSQSEKAVY